jgi:hypothetical protein
MDKHVTLVGILNIVYRSISIVVSMILAVLAAGFGSLADYLFRSDAVTPEEIPPEFMNVIPAVLLLAAIFMAVVSLAGIIGAVGVLKRKEWGRIVLLVVSFFNLLRIPLGTVLGIYGIWVLMDDRTIRTFRPRQSLRAARSRA